MAFLIYSFVLRGYALLVWLAAPFHFKARLWIKGRKNLIASVTGHFSETDQVVWIHATSLGEFEQGRPIIEAIRNNCPEKKIAITFFSPSGYEVRKDYPLADLVCYLPLDTKNNMIPFVNAIRPEALFVIKYDFWFNLFKILHNRNIPVYLVSGIFRQNQHYFKWWGRWFRNQLKAITWFFLQDDHSAGLLKGVGFSNLSVCGDTRFDRVCRVADEPDDIVLPPSLKKYDHLIVAGSTWPQDEPILLPSIHELRDTAWIIAPHQVEEYLVAGLMKILPEGSIRLSQWRPEHAPRIVVIDTMGLLNKLYRYGQVAYIGGGFGRAIHNLTEAAVYGCPVVFGPRHKQFREAHDLIRLGAGFPVTNSKDALNVFRNLQSDKTGYQKASDAASQHIRSNRGATNHILEKTGYY